MNRHVALKVMKMSDEIYEEDKKRFLQEAQILAQLNHPNIVPVYDVRQMAVITWQWVTSTVKLWRRF